MNSDPATGGSAGDVIDVMLLGLPAKATLHDAEHWSSCLDADDESRLSRLKTDRLRLKYTAGHGLLRSALSTLDPGVDPASWRFREADKGKPVVSGPVVDPPPHCSLSYTSGLIAVAVTRETPIGVDIERIDPSFPFDELTARTLSGRERTSLQTLSASDRRSRFFEIWTLKEAYLKALGVGLEPELTSLSFCPGEEGAVDIGAATAWRFELHGIGDDCRLAIAYAGTRLIPIRLRWIQLDGESGRQIEDSLIARLMS